MNPNITLTSSGTLKIYAIGFDNAFFNCLIRNSDFDPALSVKEFENSFHAFQHLLLTLNEGNHARLPMAIICGFNSLSEENFLFIHNMLAHNVLKFIPVIAMNQDGLNHKMKALKLGFDDYYDAPVNIQVLTERIKFLAAYKKEIALCEIRQEKPFQTRHSVSKRMFDIIFSSLAILFLSPLLLLIAVLIRLESPGPVIYRSRRVGTGYQVFDFLKFRSMYRDADARINDLKKYNQYNDQMGGLFLKFNNDPRVTKVGRFIRKTSLDELPQLFNILKGDMSIVGNRPLPLYEAEQLTRDIWARRFLAPAGLTGLWQVTKRGKDQMSSAERIGLDITYAEHHSFWFDLKIILKTPFALIQEENV